MALLMPSFMRSPGRHAGRQPRLQATRLRGLELDDERESGRRLDWNLRRIRAVKEVIDVRQAAPYRSGCASQATAGHAAAAPPSTMMNSRHVLPEIRAHATRGGKDSTVDEAIVPIAVKKDARTAARVKRFTCGPPANHAR
jgi:hypothetical protein